MKLGDFRRLSYAAVAVASLVLPAAQAEEPAKTLKIGVVYDLTGPFAGGGSELHYPGAKIIIDWFNQQGGIDGYKVEAIYADAQSKPDVAINEAVRLIEQEKVDMLLGFYSSAECVPAAARVEQFKKFMWITTCIASPVLEGRNLQYVFRPQPYGPPMGPHLDRDGRRLFEGAARQGPEGPEGRDHPRGRGLRHRRRQGYPEGATEAGFQVVVNEGYSASAPDLSSLVTKLKRGQPDVIFHTGYNPDITLFLRQARELGLKFSTLIGHGAGYGVYSKLKETVGADANYFFNVDPISIWQTNPKSLKPELVPIIKEVGDAYVKAKPDTVIKSAHVGMAASNTYAFLTDILPRAIKKYGGATSDDLRQAALDTDLPDGSTMLGFGIKFEPPGAPMAGQNERAYPVVVQYVDDQSYVVWPKAQQQREPVLKLPANSPYAAK